MGIFARRALAIVGGGSVAIATVLASTNPRPSDYENYAAGELATYLKSDACQQAYQIAGGVHGRLAEVGCRWAVEIGQPGLATAVGWTTERRNYLLFSVYQTQVGPEQTWPNYRRKTLAIGNRFFPVRGGWYLGDRQLSEPLTATSQ